VGHISALLWQQITAAASVLYPLIVTFVTSLWSWVGITVTFLLTPVAVLGGLPIWTVFILSIIAILLCAIIVGLLVLLVLQIWKAIGDRIWRRTSPETRMHISHGNMRVFGYEDQQTD